MVTGQSSVGTNCGEEFGVLNPSPRSDLVENYFLAICPFSPGQVGQYW